MNGPAGRPAGRRVRRARRTAGTLPRPRRAVGPVAVAVVTMVAWVAVAHNSGSGWVQALGALLAAMLAVGLAGPTIAVRRARCRVVHAPADVTAGRPALLEVEVSAPLELRPRHPEGAVTLSGAARRCTVTVVPTRRGVVSECTLEVASAAPFGLLWWTKRVTLALPRPMVVAPRMGPPDQAQLAAERAPGEDARRVAARVGEPRGVRPYRPGDLRHWVHWPGTAHTGQLMVREMEEPASRPVVLRPLLPADPDQAELVAERCLGTVAAMLERGRRVVLDTVEEDGPHARPVADVVDAGRRLARAVPGGGAATAMVDQ